MVFWIPTLVTEVVSTLSEHGQPGTKVQGAGSMITMSGWVPGPIIWAVASSQIAEFYAEHPGNDALSEPNSVYTPVSAVSFIIVDHVF